MTLTFKKAALSIAVASTLALVGCGGSSGSDSGPSSQSPNSATTVNGSAVKGVMKNAIVTAYELSDSGKRSPSAVGSARTNSEGTYTLKLSDEYKGGLLDIEVSVGTDTRMICDASKCGSVVKGQEVTLPSGFKLNSIVSKPAKGNEISAPVTAWSTMAASRTQVLVREGKSAGAAMRQATAEVSQLAGFDVANTQARSVTNISGASAAEQQAAVMNSVVAELVFAGGNASDQLTKFVGALDDGIAGNDGDDFKVAELAKKTRTVISATPGLSSDAKDALNTQAEKNSSVGDDGFEPAYDEDLDVGTGATQADKITAFKNFVTQARTWASSIEDLDSAALGNAVEVDVDTIQAAFANETIGSLKLTFELINQSLEAVVLDPTAVKGVIENGGTIPLTILDGVNEVGEASLTVVNDDGLQVTVTGTVNDQAQTHYLPFDLTLSTSLSVADLDLDTRIIKKVLASSNLTINGTVSDNSGLVIAELNDVIAQLKLGQAIEAEDGINEQQFTEEFAAASLNGQVALRASSGEHFSGDVEVGLTRLTANNSVLSEAPVSLERLRVAGDFLSADGNTFSASATLNVNNADSFDTFSWMNYSNNERWVEAPVDAEFLKSLISDELGQAVNVNARVSVYGSESYKNGYFDVSANVADGEQKFTYYQIGDAGRSELLAGTKTTLQQAGLPNTIDLEGNDPISYEPVTKNINLAEIISTGQVIESSWHAWSMNGGVEFPVSFSTRIAANIPELDAAGGFSATIQQSEGSSVQINYTANGRLRIDAHGIVAESIESAIISSISSLQDIDLDSVLVNAESQSGHISFYRPAELKYYEQCIADPVNQLPLLGYSYYLEWDSFNSEQACGEATLSYYSEYGELDAETIGLLDSEVGSKLSEVYGAELAGQLALPYYNIWTDGEYGYLGAAAQFPNLETADNFINASLTVSADVNMPELPSATIVATATRSSLNGGKVLANVNWNGGEYSLEIASDNLENASAIDARFFNAQGYELTLAVALDEAGNIGITGDAFLNGEDIGDVTLRNGAPVIIYPNGDETEFESLF